MTKEQLETYKNTYDCFDEIPSNEFDAICDELIKYKQLEEEIGCPLEVVVKALVNGIYRSLENGKIVLERSFKLNFYQGSGWHLIKPKLSFPLEDYKKTWWLREDKSE